MDAIRATDIVGRTANGQPVVANGSDTTERQADFDGVNDLGSHDDSGTETRWREWEGNPIGGDDLHSRPAKRAWCLTNDKSHPASSYYGYETPSSQDARKGHNQKAVVEMTFAQFTTPSFVTEKSVMARVNKMDAEGLSVYGGYRLLTFVAIVDSWGLSDEEVFTNDMLRAEFRQEFDDLRVNSSKALQKVFKLRGDC